MVQCQGIAHFSIPVSDLDKSTKFYRDVVGCKLINSDGKRHSFMDAGGTCILLCAEDAPINREDGKDLVHHAFMVTEEALATATKHRRPRGRHRERPPGLFPRSRRNPARIHQAHELQHHRAVIVRPGRPARPSGGVGAMGWQADSIGWKFDGAACDGGGEQESEE
jgi:catechol 2,3-dioxygenase-like lactoylglutathione lyase family enzyme